MYEVTAEARKKKKKKKAYSKKNKKKIMTKSGIPQWYFQNPPKHVKVQ
jgi:hypothetical protein